MAEKRDPAEIDVEPCGRQVEIEMLDGRQLHGKLLGHLTIQDTSFLAVDAPEPNEADMFVLAPIAGCAIVRVFRNGKGGLK